MKKRHPVRAMDQSLVIRNMRIALEQAENALKKGEIPCGCVFIDVESNRIVSVGSNQTNGGKLRQLSLSFSTLISSHSMQQVETERGTRKW